ncbi:MAG: response regulator transcription factor [Nitriliruptorales bacterium]|nr:response regulator transcription factor [Nitriliruptorales bacterium]
MADSISVYLVDDHEVVRRGLKALIEAEDDIEVVGEAASAGMAMSGITETAPDVALLDVRLPDMSGVQVCREVRSQNPDINCLMLTSFSDDEALFDAIMAGASGYLLKEVQSQDLVEAIRRVAAGESLLDPAVPGRVLERLRRGDEEDERLKSLSEQERKILSHIAEGLTNRQIAEQVHLAEKTVKNYVSNILQKLGMQRRTEAAVFYTEVTMDEESHE